jgi:hypothetical protein
VGWTWVCEGSLGLAAGGMDGWIGAIAISVVLFLWFPCFQAKTSQGELLKAPSSLKMAEEQGTACSGWWRPNQPNTSPGGRSL